MPSNNDLPPPPGQSSPLPYIIIFALLVIILVVAITFAVYYWSQSHLCGTQAHIWCSDTWTCTTACAAGSTGHSTCFNQPNLGATGLASCLYGPTASGAHLCYDPPTTGTDGVSCECTAEMAAQTSNCLSGCASKISAVNPNTVCCCKPGVAGCPFTEATLPAVCRVT